MPAAVCVVVLTALQTGLSAAVSVVPTDSASLYQKDIRIHSLDEVGDKHNVSAAFNSLSVPNMGQAKKFITAMASDFGIFWKASNQTYNHLLSGKKTTVEDRPNLVRHLMEEDSKLVANLSQLIALHAKDFLANMPEDGVTGYIRPMVLEESKSLVDLAKELALASSSNTTEGLCERIPILADHYTSLGALVAGQVIPALNRSANLERTPNRVALMAKLVAKAQSTIANVQLETRHRQTRLLALSKLLQCVEANKTLAHDATDANTSNSTVDPNTSPAVHTDAAAGEMEKKSQEEALATTAAPAAEVHTDAEIEKKPQEEALATTAAPAAEVHTDAAAGEIEKKPQEEALATTAAPAAEVHADIAAAESKKTPLEAALATTAAPAAEVHANAAAAESEEKPQEEALVTTAAPAAEVHVDAAAAESEKKPQEGALATTAAPAAEVHAHAAAAERETKTQEEELATTAPAIAEGDVKATSAESKIQEEALATTAPPKAGVEVSGSAVEGKTQQEAASTPAPPAVVAEATAPASANTETEEATPATAAPPAVVTEEATFATAAPHAEADTPAAKGSTQGDRPAPVAPVMDAPLALGWPQRESVPQERPEKPVAPAAESTPSNATETQAQPLSKRAATEGDAATAAVQQSNALRSGCGVAVLSLALLAASSF